MKIFRFLIPLALLAATAFGQVTMTQAPGQYTDGTIPVRSGTGNRFVNAPDLIYNSGTNTLATNISGNAATATSSTSTTNATNATNVGITNDTTTNATMFPLWVTANTGNLPAKTTSTKLSFNPSTGILTSTGFVGTLNGNTFTTGTYTLTGTAGKTLTFTNSVTLTGTDGTTMTFPATTATIARTDAAQTFTGVQTFTSPATTTSITTASTSFTAWAGATTLLTFGGTGATASTFHPSTLDATSSTTGAIRTSGGISAAKALNIGTTGIFGTSVSAPSIISTASITLFSSATPTTTAAQMAFDNNAWATSFGAVQVHNGTANTFLVGVEASDTPSNGQFPRWNTGGTITWENPTASAAGSDTYVQFNDGGTALGGDGGMTYNKTTDVLTAAGSVVVGSGASTAGAVVLGQGTTQSTGTTNITLQAPAAVTSYIRTLPGAVGSTGFLLETVSGSTQTESLVTGTGTGNVVRAVNPTIQSPVYTVAAVAASAIDWNAGDYFTKTLAANTTFTFSNAATGKQIVVAVTNTASNYTVTWPTVSWSGGTPPVQTVGAKVDIYTFIQIGSTIYGSVVQNF